MNDWQTVGIGECVLVECVFLSLSCKYTCKFRVLKEKGLLYNNNPTR